MAEKNSREETETKESQRTENRDSESKPEVPVGKTLGDIVTLVHEINTRHISDTAADQKARKSQLRWQRGHVVVTGLLAAGTLFVLALTYFASDKLAKTAKNQATIMATQAAILDKQAIIMGQQREIASNTVATIKAQLDEQVAANRPAIVANGAFPAQPGPIPESWMTIGTKGSPPQNVVINWRNVGKSIGADFVQKGHLRLANPGESPPTDPECNELHRPEKQTNMTALAPDATMPVVWGLLPGTDLADMNSGQILYAVGCAYYSGLDKGAFFPTYV